MNGIAFGDWMLVPADRDNWELYHLHVNASGKNVGRKTWHRLGKYYQWNTVGAAVEYAANQDMKQMMDERTMHLSEAMEEHTRIVREMVSEIKGSEIWKRPMSL